MQHDHRTPGLPRTGTHGCCGWSPRGRRRFPDTRRTPSVAGTMKDAEVPRNCPGRGKGASGSSRDFRNGKSGRCCQDRPHVRPPRRSHQHPVAISRMAPCQVRWSQHVARTTAKRARWHPDGRSGETLILPTPGNLEFVPHRQQIDGLGSARQGSPRQSGKAPVSVLPACNRSPEGAHTRRRVRPDRADQSIGVDVVRMRSQPRDEDA